MILVFSSSTNTESDFTSTESPNIDDMTRKPMKKTKKPAVTIKIAVKFAKTNLKKLFIYLKYLLDMSFNNVILLLGSNINNPEANIQKALIILEKRVGAILRKSELIRTEPVGFVSSNIFCNIAIQIKTQYSPIELLNALKITEQEMGRLQDSSYFGTYQDRIIDIDIVLYNNVRFISGRLVIPHYKNLYERDFAKKIINTVR